MQRSQMTSEWCLPSRMANAPNARNKFPRLIGSSYSDAGIASRSSVPYFRQSTNFLSKASKLHVMMASRQRLPVFGYFTRKMCRSPLKLSKVIYRRRGSIKRPASHYYFTWALFDLVLLVLPKQSGKPCIQIYTLSGRPTCRC